ncbi:TPA: aldehyde dehydrogenase (NADP(+)) [Burkholderia cenocepacia]|uniref:Aldehyde dehydrogenase (NADP(+)) n=1 Tax=Burkholderia latens TaxID=488446 RepID=A0A6H9T6J1_9BURK|nr:MULTISPECIES: aldehyde dehydrogenase (NADP(+)) [Burkholderia]KAB0644684.1 aldehyde dehydrogenase (NADP(+)) [Burkholderia latens]MBJ9922839.1 aldehyde dehydrogenase (NADP(+)) [Burkholderia cenocepacia]UJH78826.1 aldehyde dehydrogenase (NADP(+)) [Burkholderia cenocepacia]VWB22761.1 fatty aldehyde dehydrogenase [Burkholderia latens]HDR9879849.1 aldehyde dehydrogenase (NADP(+)) [Burkholderia cenocepacia]
MNAVVDPIANPAIERAVALAREAQPVYATAPANVRSALLRGLADALERHAAELVSLAHDETHLGHARLNGELARTAFQLRGFAERVDAGVPFETINDVAVPGTPPVGRPRLTRVQEPLGPVAMFSASNFPFAFSVFGGDTASALAAGCVVIVKPHAGHPELSRRVHALAADVLLEQALPAGVIAFVDQVPRDAGTALVSHPAIAAVAFTGSYQGGVALWRAANARPRPVPFYGELGSINPLVVQPAALADGVDAPAATLAASITLGSGQFCTSPGLLLVRDDEDGEHFVVALADALAKQAPHRMLTPGMRAGFEHASSAIAAQPGVHTRLAPADADDAIPAPRLYETTAEQFVAQPALQEEMFGPAALVVRVHDNADVLRVLEAIGGSLTVTLWGATDDTPENRALAAAAARIGGRVLFGGVPTGVAVCDAQQHGGPWPASTNPQSTSVGYAAVARFLRPVALQDPPGWAIDAYRGGLPS